MVLKIRLQNHGCRNHPYWWLVVQGLKVNPKGRIIEKNWNVVAKKYEEISAINCH